MKKIVFTFLTLTIFTVAFFKIKDVQIGPRYFSVTKLYIDTTLKKAYVIYKDYDYDIHKNYVFSINYDSGENIIYWSKKINFNGIIPKNSIEVYIERHPIDPKIEIGDYKLEYDKYSYYYKVVKIIDNIELFKFKYKKEFKKNLVYKFDDLPKLFIIPSILGLLIAYLNIILNIKKHSLMLWGLVLHSISSLIIFMTLFLLQGLWGSSKSISYMPLKYFLSGVVVYLIFESELFWKKKSSPENMEN